MGSDSAESKILIIDWWEAEVAEKEKAMGGKGSIVENTRKYITIRIVSSFS
jgi:hypothetical protein